MNKIKHHFQFDIRLLKGIYMLPFIGYLIALLLMVLSYPEGSYLPYIFLQGIAIPAAGLHLVFLYTPIYEEGATDTLLHYYRRNLVNDLLRYSLLHGVFILFLTGLLVLVKGVEFLDLIKVMHLFLLFLFYQVIGISILTIVKSLEITIAIYAIYTVTEVVTLGNFLPWPHLFLFEEPFYDIWLFLTFFFLVVGIILSIVQLIRALK
ncbi:hypothetical protein [Oceanobacillus sp. J11TS1]|uniref:hypothetical protein n=1 Tax=Oceanobacillus sp. J11TS1 TaxID=2807191 RepID=UPI001B0BE4D0|nr:hypothetical protein [Oceanobacillus sp. J11TS1]GIO22092.1 hypothetical protein J11TS1_06730 [Oceanobacillus sp. J11TS1]